MTIRQRLYLGHACTALAVVFVGFVAFVTLSQLRGLLADPAAAPVLDRATLLIVAAAGLGMLAIGGLTWWTTRSIVTPLRRLTRAAQDLSAGEPSERLPVDSEDEIGDLARAFNDVTESIQRRTVSRSYLNNILDSMAEMLFVVNRDGTIQRSNRAAQRHLGFEASELETMPITDLFVDGEPWSTTDMDALQRQGYTAHTERTLRTRAGDTLPVLFSRAALQSEGNTWTGMVCVAQDISDRKAAEKQIKASLQEKEVLLREIHHRVKNNLQIISSLLHLQSKNVDGEAAQQLFAESQHRVRSMALIHEHLYQSDDLAQVDFEAYLDRLTEHLIRSYGARGVSLELDADGAPISVDRAIPCGLIVNELVTNALKHAFPEEAPGTISVRFAMESNRAELVVADDGTGLANDADLEQTGSLGLKLVRGLVQQLSGTLAIEHTPGLRFVITFPLQTS